MSSRAGSAESPASASVPMENRWRRAIRVVPFVSTIWNHCRPGISARRAVAAHGRCASALTAGNWLPAATIAASAFGKSPPARCLPPGKPIPSTFLRWLSIPAAGYLHRLAAGRKSVYGTRRPPTGSCWRRLKDMMIWCFHWRLTLTGTLLLREVVTILSAFGIWNITIATFLETWKRRSIESA